MRTVEIEKGLVLPISRVYEGGIYSTGQPRLVALFELVGNEWKFHSHQSWEDVGSTFSHMKGTVGKPGYDDVRFVLDQPQIPKLSEAEDYRSMRWTGPKLSYDQYFTWEKHALVDEVKKLVNDREYYKAMVVLRSLEVHPRDWDLLRMQTFVLAKLDDMCYECAPDALSVIAVLEKICAHF